MWQREITYAPATAEYWAQQSKFSDTVVHEAAGALSASRVTCNFSRTTPAGTQEDFASFTFHLCVNIAAASWVKLSDSQKTDAEVDINAFIGTLNGQQYSGFTHKEIVWHDVEAGDKYYGPRERTTLTSNVGVQATGRLPDQLAVNVTLRTSSRKHWGRMYFPGIAAARYDTTYGRVLNGTCDVLAQAVRDLGTALTANTAHTELVVYSHVHQAVLSVDEIHCDNIADVIRRRRAKEPSYRKVYTS